MTAFRDVSCAAPVARSEADLFRSGALSALLELCKPFPNAVDAFLRGFIRKNVSARDGADRSVRQLFFVGTEPLFEIIPVLG